MALGQNVSVGKGNVARYWLAAASYTVIAVAIGLLVHWVWATIPAALGLYAAALALVASAQGAPPESE